MLSFDEINYKLSPNNLILKEVFTTERRRL